MQTEPLTRAEARQHRTTVRDELATLLSEVTVHDYYLTTKLGHVHDDIDGLAARVVDAILYDRETAAAMRALLGA